MSRYIRIFIIFTILFVSVPCAVFIKKDKLQGHSESEVFDFSLPEKIQLMNNDTSSLSEITLNDYLIGCVLAQMTSDFDIEALKCQAILSRTCLAYNLYHQKDILTTTQKYFSPEQAKSVYGSDFNTAIEKAAHAVSSTESLILTYKNEPIVAAYHPISNGCTESSKDIWGVDLPYLAGVKSPFDTETKNGIQSLEITKTELFSRLCAFLALDEKQNYSLEIKSKTDSGSVLSLEISSSNTKKEIAGTKFAEIFNLNSCNFTFSIENDMCLITCYGVGHLVGLSQWGANLMALSGNSCTDILCHYFTNVSLLDAK